MITPVSASRDFSPEIHCQNLKYHIFRLAPWSLSDAKRCYSRSFAKRKGRRPFAVRARAWLSICRPSLDGATAFARHDTTNLKEQITLGTARIGDPQCMKRRLKLPSGRAIGEMESRSSIFIPGGARPQSSVKE